MFKSIKSLFEKETGETRSSGGLFASQESNVFISNDDAMQITAVNQAVKKISGSIASLPLLVKKDGKEIKNDLYRIINNPNKHQTKFDFLTVISRSLLIDANAYIELVRNKQGKLTGLIAHDSSSVSQEILNSAKSYRYRVNDQFGRSYVLLDHEICHIKYNPVNMMRGISPVRECADAIELALHQQAFALSYNKKGCMVSGVLTSDGRIPDESFNRIVSEWKQTYGGSKNSGKTLILEHGLKYTPISSDMIQSDFNNLRIFSVQECARIFNISPILLGDLSHGTYSNHSEAMRSFHSDTLRPWLCLIECAIEKSLNLVGGVTIEFDTSPMLRLNQGERFDSYTKAKQSGIFTLNELRAMEGLPPIDGGDRILTPANEPNAPEAGNPTNEPNLSANNGTEAA